MPIPVAGQVGPAALADGVTTQPFRQGRTSELIATELHGRFYETNFRAALFSGGIGLTAINNATYTTGTLTASCTPIVGVWNPATSSVNLVILQATLAATMTALTVTGGGPYAWATSTSNAAISTGNAPFNRKTFTAAGSQAKDMSNVALTGLTNNLVVRNGSSLGGGSASNTSFTATAVAMQTQLLGFTENLDGSFIVPPGGVLALLATTTPVANSVTAGIIWEEIAL